MITTTCFYLAYAASTICYQNVPVPALQPLPPPIVAPLASVTAAPNVWGQSVVPTWQDIIRQQESDDED